MGYGQWDTFPKHYYVNGEEITIFNYKIHNPPHQSSRRQQIRNSTTRDVLTNRGAEIARVTKW